MPTSLSRPFDSLLYHQYLKGETSLRDAKSVRSESIPSQSDESSFQLPFFHWDLQASCKPMFPAFDYISQKLSLHGLSIALIISYHDPYIIPVWVLPRKSQVILTRIVRKACRKFSTTPSWMTALAALSNQKDLPRVFESYQPDSYITRRSVVQHELVYSTEGLTLLSIDHVYTFKRLLCTLSKKDWVIHPRDVSLSSCVHLLHRIHKDYAGKAVLKGHIVRVYEEIEFHEEILDEVYSAYDANYCTASIYEVAFEPDFAVPLSNGSASWSSTAAEMQAASNFDIESSDSENLISSPVDVDQSTSFSLEPDDMNCTTSQDIPNPLHITHRRSSKVSEGRQSKSKLFELRPTAIGPIESLSLETEKFDQYNSEGNFLYDWDSEASPSPLQISKPAGAPQNEILETADSPIDDYILDHLESPSRYIECWSTLAPSALCSKCNDTVSIYQRVTLY